MAITVNRSAKFEKSEKVISMKIPFLVVFVIKLKKRRVRVKKKRRKGGRKEWNYFIIELYDNWPGGELKMKENFED